MDWRVLLATSRTDTWLVAKDPRIKSLKDFGPNDKIGVVAPDAQQAIILRKAAQQQLGNAHALDKNLAAISSADGEQALLSGQIAANFAGSLFQESEVAAGRHIVLHSRDVFGPVGPGVIVLPQSFYNQYPNFSEEAAQYLAQDQGSGTAPQFKTLLDSKNLTFQTTRPAWWPMPRSCNHWPDFQSAEFREQPGTAHSVWNRQLIDEYYEITILSDKGDFAEYEKRTDQARSISAKHRPSRRGLATPCVKGRWGPELRALPATSADSRAGKNLIWSSWQTAWRCGETVILTR